MRWWPPERLHAWWQIAVLKCLLLFIYLYCERAECLLLMRSMSALESTCYLLGGVWFLFSFFPSSSFFFLLPGNTQSPLLGTSTEQILLIIIRTFRKLAACTSLLYDQIPLLQINSACWAVIYCDELRTLLDEEQAARNVLSRRSSSFAPSDAPHPNNRPHESNVWTD